MKEKVNLALLKTVGILGISVMLVFSLIVFFLMPKISELLSTKKKISEQEARIKILSDKLLTLSSLSEVELSNSASLLADTIPVQKDFYGLLIKIKSIFQLENIPILSYSLNPGLLASDSGKKVKENKENTLQVQVSFLTNFEGVGRLIDRLEKSLPLTIIDSLAMKAETASESAQSLNLSLPAKMVISGFYSPLQKQLGEVGASVPKATSQSLAILEKLKDFSRYDVEVLDSGTTVTVGKENPF